MLIRLYANREFLKDPTNHYNKRWIIAIPGKTIYANDVVIECVGWTHFEIGQTPSAFIEFEGEVKQMAFGLWKIKSL